MYGYGKLTQNMTIDEIDQEFIKSGILKKYKEVIEKQIILYSQLKSYNEESAIMIRRIESRIFFLDYLQSLMTKTDEKDKIKYIVEH